MTNPRGLGFGDEVPEDDMAEQLIPVDVGDDETDLDDVRVSISREADASEADLIDQAIAVPLPDDDPDLDR